MKIRSEQAGLEADIYLYQEGDELPESGTYFVITGEGFFIHVDGGMVSGLVPCREREIVPFLGKLEENASYNFPPIPFECFVQALTFLRTTYKKHRSEACVLVLYRIPTLNFRVKQATEQLRMMQENLPKNKEEWNKEQRLQIIEQVNLIKEFNAQYAQDQANLNDGGSGGLTGIDHSECEYIVVCPKQKVSSGGVHYGKQHTGEHITDLVNEIRKSDPLVEECGDDFSHQFMHVCSIHSHPDFNAYHSGIDDSDEFIWDGLHLTIGGVMKPDFEISASLTLQGSRFMLDPLDVVDGVAKSEAVQPRALFGVIPRPSNKDLYHLAYKPENVLCVKAIEKVAARWLKEKVSTKFFYGGGNIWEKDKPKVGNASVRTTTAYKPNQNSYYGPYGPKDDYDHITEEDTEDG